MTEKKPVEELGELIPYLEGMLCGCDIRYIMHVYRMASGREPLPGVDETLKVRAHITADYLDSIAENVGSYTSNSEAQGLLKRTVEVMKHIE